MSHILLTDVLARGVTIDPREAVAIAQLLIVNGASAPSLENVELSSDGNAFCRGCDVTPGVFEIGVLLQSLIPPGVPHLPGGLRYAIARALLDVDAPPFDCVDDFSRTLARFERGDRADEIRGLLARYFQAGGRRRAPLSSLPVQVVQMPQPSRRRNRARSVVAAAMLIGVIGLAGVVHMTNPRSGRQQSAAERGGVTAPASASSTLPADVARPRRQETAAQASQSSSHATPAVARRQNRVRRDVAATRGDASPRTMVLPAFASNGSALFIRDGQSARASDPMDASGGDFGVMTIVDDGARNYHVQPSPDGSQVAFDSDRDGERGVYVARRDGMNVRRLSGAGFAALPAWAPDGRRIAYIRAEADNPTVWNLWVQSLADDRASRLTSYRSGRTWTASWFTDNRRICYSHDDALVVLDVIDGTARTFASPVPRIPVATPAVSPDGTRVIFQVAGHGIWILTLDTGAMRSILDDPTAAEFAWSRDGRRVAFHSRRDNRWGILVISPD